MNYFLIYCPVLISIPFKKETLLYNLSVKWQSLTAVGGCVHLLAALSPSSRHLLAASSVPSQRPLTVFRRLLDAFSPPPRRLLVA